MPGCDWSRRDASASCSFGVETRRSIASCSSCVLELVGRQPHAEADLLDALRVVVLVPEERQHDHRLAEVDRLGDRVVAAVRDHEVDLRQDRRLRQELGAGHVRRELDRLVLRALADDVAVRRLGERGDEAVHQLDVGRAEAAEADVDERARRRAAARTARPPSARRSRAAASARRAAASARSRPRRDRGRGSGTATRGRTRAPAAAARRAPRRRPRTRAAAARAARGSARGTRPSPPGRRSGSRRRPAAAPGPSARAGCRRRSAPTAGPEASTAGKPTTLSWTITSGSSSPKISASRSST